MLRRGDSSSACASAIAAALSSKYAKEAALKCRDDDEAIRQAWQLREGRGVEVWQEGRLVVQLPRDPR